MKKIAIIPARGGSKRIPKKNIKPFAGQPIIGYSIQAALNAGLFDEVMVSTDSEEIAAIAKSFGATVPFLRSEKNADDFATTIDVIVEVLNDYSKQNVHFSHACCIYPTAPFVNKAILQQAYQQLIDEKLDCVFPVLPFSFPIQRAVKRDESGKIEMFQPKHMASRSQDLEKAYHDAGQFYWLNTKAFLEKKKLWTDNTGSVVLNELDAHDIDTFEDWEVAEFKFKLKEG